VLQKRFWLLFSMTLAIVAAAIVGTYASLQESVAARPLEGICWTQNATPLCYSQSITLSSQTTNALAVSPSGQTFASAVRDRIQLWDLQTAQPILDLQGHKNWITALAFSPNGAALASASLDGTIKLWDLASGALITSLRSGRVSAIGFSPDGTTLAAGSRMLKWTDGKTSPEGIQLWDLATQQLRATLGTRAVSAIAFSPDGKLLAGGSSSTRIWDLATQKLVQTLDSGELTALKFTPDSQTLVTGSSRTKLWQPSSGQLLQTLNSGTLSLALSSDGQLFATTSGGSVYLWRWPTRQVFGSLRGSWLSNLVVDFAQNGQVLISGSSDGLRLWRSHEQSALPPGKVMTQR
jgi:WD40 repeat protein